ncbi:MAG: flavin reductase family protein [Pseudomonadota bacterium]
MQDVVAKALLHGLYVLTCKDGQRINGMTAAWVSQVSFNPLLIAVSVAPERHTHELLQNSSHFALNSLRGGQLDLARKFGFRSGRNTDKLEGIAHHPAANGSPVLDDAVAYVECRIQDTVTTGDHTLFIGEAVDGKVLADQDVLPFRWGDFFK